MNVLVIAAHPDDEVLGCGGTIAKHAQAGDNVYVILMAEGITSRIDDTAQGEQLNTELRLLEASSEKANKILGVKELINVGFPDNRMDSLPLLNVIKKVEQNVNRINPEIIYTHHAGDLNIDHRRTHEAVVTAFRPFPGSKIKSLLFFEINSSTNWQVPGTTSYFTPNWFEDISGTIDLKKKALQAYCFEMRQYPHSRSLEAIDYLAFWRGSSVGVGAAEAFMLGRHICR